MTPSPPIEAPEFRSGNLTPVSPKPVHFPGPSNIPVLERQMDPVFNNTATHLSHDNSFHAADSDKAPLTQPSPLYFFIPGFANGNSHPVAQEERPESLHSGYSPSGLESKVDQGTDDQVAATPGSDLNLPNPEFTTSQHQPEDAAFHGPNGHHFAFSTSMTDPTHTAIPHQDMNVVIDATADQGRGAPGEGADSKDEPDVSNESEGGVNFQTILDRLAHPTADPSSAESITAANTGSLSINTHFPSSSNVAGNIKSPISALPSNPNLPPRPPPQEKPATHPNYAPGDDIRLYHPHPQNPNGPNAPHLSGIAYRSNAAVASRSNVNIPSSIVTPGSGSISTAGNGMLPPSAINAPQPSQQLQQSPPPPDYRQRDSVERRSSPSLSDEDTFWGHDVQKIYDQFLQDERVYVNEGAWDRFPPNSRLFIGNLPSEKISKRDIFRKFYKYGKLAQISIKQAYGFVQFLEAGACQTALQEEQGSTLRGRKIHLETSKPQGQKGSGNSGTQQGRGRNRRSRSPDYTRGGTGPPKQQDRGTQRNRDNAHDRPRGRDGYRPMRSPSPLVRGYRGGRGARSPGRRDSWRRSRSRSRSPYGRYRGGSPRRSFDDELPLPHRDPKEVPDVQIMVVDNLDQDFLRWVETAFRDRGVRVDVLILSPRLSEPKVVERQIVEGVLAICRLTRINQQTGKIPVKIFKRIPGAAEVGYDDYDNLDPSICADLVNRAKQLKNAPAQPQYSTPQPAYGTSQFGMPPQQQPQPLHAPLQFQAPQQPQIGTSSLANIISSLDSNNLQKLLGAIQQPPQTPQTPLQPIHQPHQPVQPPSGLTPDLARLLSGVQQPQPQQAHAYPQQQPQGYPQQQQQQPFYHQQQQQQQPQQPVQHQHNPFASLTSNPSLASLLGAAGLGQQPQQQMAPQQPPIQPPAPSHQATPDMQQIMAQLSRYRQ